MIRVIIAGIFILAGIFLLSAAVIGIFRFSHTLNRIHAAAKCDTMGAIMVLAGLMVLSGWNMFSLKLAVVMVFMSVCSPAAYYLAACAEVKTNCDFVDMTKEGMSNDDA